MTTTTASSSRHRPLVSFTHDYAHDDQEDWHQHDCAQLLHVLNGVVRIATPAGYWVALPRHGVWLPAGTSHALCMTGDVTAHTLSIDPLARADLPADRQIVQIMPLLWELIVSSLGLAECYAPASHNERIYELILDEIRGMAILPFSLPEPQSDTLCRLCQQIRETPGKAWGSGQAVKVRSMSERTLSRHFQQQISLTQSEWMRRARLMEVLIRPVQGHSVLQVTLELGYGSYSIFSAMFRRVMGAAPSDYSRPST